MSYYMSKEAKGRWEASAKTISEEAFVEYYSDYEDLKAKGRVRDMSDEQFAWYVQDMLASMRLPETPPVFARPLDLENMKLSLEQLKAVREFMANVDDSKAENPGLYLFGGPGAGKTRLAYVIRRLLCEERYEAIQQGQRLAPREHPIFITVSELLRREKRDFEREPDDKHRPVDYLTRYEGILFLDDLGAEKATDWSIEILWSIIDARYLWKRPTVYTSNLSLDGLAAALGDRIASRIAGSCVAIDLGNEDHRLQ